MLAFPPALVRDTRRSLTDMTIKTRFAPSPTGFLHIVFHVTDLGNGRMSVNMVRHPQGITGVSTTGGEYVAGGSYSEVLIVPTGSAQVFSVASPFIFVGKAEAPTVHVTEVVHFTVNAKGKATASVEYLNFRC